MEKKESYRHILPHFQQPGQAYFVTWNLKDAVPPKALERYTIQLQIIRARLGAANSDSRGENCDSEIAAPHFRGWKWRHPIGKSEIAAHKKKVNRLLSND